MIMSYHKHEGLCQYVLATQCHCFGPVTMQRRKMQFENNQRQVVLTVKILISYSMIVRIVATQVWSVIGITYSIFYPSWHTVANYMLKPASRKLMHADTVTACVDCTALVVFACFCPIVDLTADNYCCHCIVFWPHIEQAQTWSEGWMLLDPNYMLDMLPLASKSRIV